MWRCNSFKSLAARLTKFQSNFSPYLAALKFLWSCIELVKFVISFLI